MTDARVVYLRIPGTDGVFVELLEYHGTDGRPVTPRAWIRAPVTCAST